MSIPDRAGAAWVTGGSGAGRGSMLALGDRIVEAAEAQLGAAVSPRPTDLLCEGVPVLSRGDAWIVPLTYRQPVSEPEEEEHRRRAGELWRGIRGACEFRHGAGLSVDLEGDAPNAYVSALRAQGARRADWWSSGRKALVLVTQEEPAPASALHVVPLGWVSQVSPSRRIRAVDLSWHPGTG